MKALTFYLTDQQAFYIRLALLSAAIRSTDSDSLLSPSYFKEAYEAMKEQHCHIHVLNEEEA